MNSDATNYNAEATEDDGSCQLPVKGCMDANAKNFNNKATQDDGSCEGPDPKPDPNMLKPFSIRAKNDWDYLLTGDSIPGTFSRYLSLQRI